MTLLREISELADALSDVLFPPTCNFCESDADVDADSFLCGSCQKQVREIIPPFCNTCGLPFHGLTGSSAGYCGRCLAHPPAYETARCAVAYEGVLRDSLVRFKYYGALHLSRTLSDILIRAFHRYFDPTHYDLIIPIPIHRKRLAVRGFNQALLLAERLSSHTGIPLDRTTFGKTRDTPPQVGLSRHERVKNIRGSFAVSNPARIRDRRILLVDDVITTGSTIAEAAVTLRRGKASSVSALVLALRIGLPDDPAPPDPPSVHP